MTIRDRLRALVEAAPAGTMVPVESLAELLNDRAAEHGGEPIAHLTLTEASDEIGRAPSTIRNWLAAGDIPEAYRMNGREWRIPRDALRAYLDRQIDDRSENGRSNSGRRSRPRAMGSWQEHIPSDK